MRRKTNGEGPPKPIAPPVWDKDPHPRVAPGRRLVRVTGWQGPDWLRMGQRYSLRLECVLVDEDDPAALSIFFNLAGKPGAIGLPGRQSKYYKHWVMSNGAEPRKGEEMHWKIFLDKWFIAEVEDATTDKDGNEKPAAEVYSRIKHFIRLVEM